MSEKKYVAAAYMRLSKKPGDYAYDESESIESQRKIITNYAKGHEEIRLIEEYVDDGYTGTNFNRPGFKSMLDKIRSGEINCVICKDLSRFGRNYIDSGLYLEKIFPFMGVRFISISERIDSKDMSYGDMIMIPFMNVLNEAYSRDLSKKIKSSLATKRKAGEFVGAFVTYGYKKDPEKRNRIVVDFEAASVVKNIFRKRIEGMCNQAIANELNDIGVKCPGEYAKSKGMKLHCQWQKRDQMRWDAVTVKRILENEIYLGTLIQGKTFKPALGAELAIPKPKDMWDRVENNHEGIVSERDYNLVQKLLLMDTRVSPIHKVLYPLAGLLKCADCGYSMIRVSVPHKEGKGQYYRCGNYKKNGVCTSHNINAKQLEDEVFAAICKRVEEVHIIQDKLEVFDDEYLMRQEIKRLENNIQDLKDNIRIFNSHILSLEEHTREGLITEDEMREFEKIYGDRVADCNREIAELYKHIQMIKQSPDREFAWMIDFTEFDIPKELSRYLAVRTVDYVSVAENHVLDIHLNHEEEYQKFCKFI